MKRALAISEKALGRDHSDVGAYLYGLATVYAAQTRYAEAEPLFKRALVIAAKNQWVPINPRPGNYSVNSPHSIELCGVSPRLNRCSSARWPLPRKTQGTDHLT